MDTMGQNTQSPLEGKGERSLSRMIRAARKSAMVMMGMGVLAAFGMTASAAGQGNSADASLGRDVVFMVPDESPGAPYYAISGNGGFIPHDGTWAAIPFHRDPACVPPAAPLLQLVGPAAFGCTLTVEGHEHWENGPGVDLAPRQTVFYGLGAVPIVFVRWADLAPALAGGLTLPELLGLQSTIVGSAVYYKEADILGISGPQGAGKGSYKITARGWLADGRSFNLHVNEVLGALRVVQITFGSPF